MVKSLCYGTCNFEFGRRKQCEGIKIPLGRNYGGYHKKSFLCRGKISKVKYVSKYWMVHRPKCHKKPSLGRRGGGTGQISSQPFSKCRLVVWRKMSPFCTWQSLLNACTAQTIQTTLYLISNVITRLVLQRALGVLSRSFFLLHEN